MPTGYQERDMLYPLQKAIKARLDQGNITYSAVVGSQKGSSVAVKVYDRPPEDAALPMIYVGEIAAQAPNNTKTRIGKDLIFTVHVVSEYQGNKEAAYIANQVMKLITSPRLDLSADRLFVMKSSAGQVQPRTLEGQLVDWAVQINFTIFEMDSPAF